MARKLEAPGSPFSPRPSLSEGEKVLEGRRRLSHEAPWPRFISRPVEEGTVARRGHWGFPLSWAGSSVISSCSFLHPSAPLTASEGFRLLTRQVEPPDSCLGRSLVPVSRASGLVLDCTATGTC